MQRAAIIREAKAHRQRIDVWYSEKVSSANSPRPELRRLLEDARQGRITCVWVYALDRLSRGGICETLNMVRKLQQFNCQPRSVADGFSLGGPADEIILSVIAWAAQYERARILARIAAARIRVEAIGGDWGRPRRLTKDDPVIAKIRKLKGQGKTVRQIAMSVHVPKSVVGRILSQKEATKSRATNAKKRAG